MSGCPIYGAIVEAAGMLASAAYRHKIETKQAIANRHGLVLLVIEPSDLDRLDQVFA